jgi:hypothetical protein
MLFSVGLLQAKRGWWIRKLLVFDMNFGMLTHHEWGKQACDLIV